MRARSNKSDKRGGVFAPRQKGKNAKSPFDEALQSWVDKDYGVALDLLFRSRRDPAIKQDNFVDWFRPTITRACPALEEIFDRYCIPPGEILEILACYKIESHLYSPKLKSSLRSNKLREKDAKLIEKAAKALKKWEAILGSLHPTLVDVETLDGGAESEYRLSELLIARANEIRASAPTAAYRPKRIDQIECAKQLAMKFRQRTGGPRNAYIGELIWAAFGQKKKPKSFEDFGKRLTQAHLTGKELERIRPLVDISMAPGGLS